MTESPKGRAGATFGLSPLALIKCAINTIIITLVMHIVMHRAKFTDQNRPWLFGENHSKVWAR